MLQPGQSGDSETKLLQEALNVSKNLQRANPNKRNNRKSSRDSDSDFITTTERQMSRRLTVKEMTKKFQVYRIITWSFGEGHSFRRGVKFFRNFKGGLQFDFIFHSQLWIRTAVFSDLGGGRCYVTFGLIGLSPDPFNSCPKYAGVLFIPLIAY